MSSRIIEIKIAELSKWYRMTEDFSTKKDILQEIEQLRKTLLENDESNS